MEPLVVWAPEHRINLLAVFPRVGCGYVVVEGFLTLPDLDDDQMIRGRDLRAGLNLH